MQHLHRVLAPLGVVQRLVSKRMWPWIRERYRSDTFSGAVAASVINTGVVLLVAA